MSGHRTSVYQSCTLTPPRLYRATKRCRTLVHSSHHHHHHHHNHHLTNLFNYSHALTAASRGPKLVL